MSDVKGRHTSVPRMLQQLGVNKRDKPECDDRRCKAVENPKTLAEYKASLEHWREHSYLCGCAHGN